MCKSAVGGVLRRLGVTLPVSLRSGGSLYIPHGAGVGLGVSSGPQTSCWRMQRENALLGQVVQRIPGGTSYFYMNEEFRIIFYEKGDLFY